MFSVFSTVKVVAPFWTFCNTIHYILSLSFYVQHTRVNIPLWFYQFVCLCHLSIEGTRLPILLPLFNLFPCLKIYTSHLFNIYITCHIVDINYYDKPYEVKRLLSRIYRNSVFPLTLLYIQLIEPTPIFKCYTYIYIYLMWHVNFVYVKIL